jgi:hypothetical protein
MVMLLALPVLIDINLEILTIIILLVVVLQAFMNYAVVKSRYALYVLTGFSMFLLSHLFLILAGNNVTRQAESNERKADVPFKDAHPRRYDARHPR